MDLNKYLEILGFPKFANPSHEEIKKRWKDLCKEHHPDKGGDEAKFREVTEAYKMLTDIDYRTRHKPMESTNLNMTIQFPLKFEEAFSGTKMTFTYNVMELDDRQEPIQKETLETETVTVVVPPGSFGDDFRVTLAGKGLRKGDTRGQVTFVPARIPHPTFQVKPRRGWASARSWDIVSNVTVPLHSLLTGAKIDVLTMKGVVKIKIPAGTTPGSEIVIPGKGCEGGDHVVVVGVSFPTKEELKSGKWATLHFDWGSKVEDKEEEEYLDVFNGLEE